MYPRFGIAEVKKRTDSVGQVCKPEVYSRLGESRYHDGHAKSERVWRPF